MASGRFGRSVKARVVGDTKILSQSDYTNPHGPVPLTRSGPSDS